MKNLNITNSNIDEYGRFTRLKNSVNYNKAKELYPDIPEFILKMKIDSLLREYIINNNLIIEKKEVE